MNRLAIFSLLLLSGCGGCTIETSADRRAAFLTRCTAAEFTAPQCALLADMKADAEDDAAAAAIVGAVGLGVGAAAQGQAAANATRMSQPSRR